MPDNLSQMFLNRYALTKQIIDHPDFDEGEWPADIVNAVINDFEITDAYELRPLLPRLTKAGEALLREIEADNAD